MMCSNITGVCYIDDFGSIINFINHTLVYAVLFGTLIGVILLSIKER